jgi:hypothetical protein
VSMMLADVGRSYSLILSYLGYHVLGNMVTPSLSHYVGILLMWWERDEGSVMGCGAGRMLDILLACGEVLMCGFFNE